MSRRNKSKKQKPELDPGLRRMDSKTAFKVDWSRKCSNCKETPVVNVTGLCGPCTFGEADTARGNW